MFVFHGVPSVDRDSCCCFVHAPIRLRFHSRVKRKAASDGAPSLSAFHLDSATRADLLIRVASAGTAYFSPSSSGERLLSDRSRNGVNGSIRALRRARRCTAVPGHCAHPAILSVASWHGEGAAIKHDSRRIAVGKRLASRGFGEEPGAGEQERSSGVIVLRRDGPGPALRMGR